MIVVVWKVMFNPEEVMVLAIAVIIIFVPSCSRTLFYCSSSDCSVFEAVVLIVEVVVRVLAIAVLCVKVLLKFLFAVAVVIVVVVLEIFIDVEVVLIVTECVVVAAGRVIVFIRENVILVAVTNVVVNPGVISESIIFLHGFIL